MAAPPNTPNIPVARPMRVRDGVALGLLCAALAILTRAAVWPFSVVDWDESLYLLVGRDVLAGRLPYDGVFDHKPAGLYYLFASAQAAFGQTVTSIRVLAMLACAIAAFFLGLYAHRRLGGGLITAALTGTLYLVLSMANGGLATNTEILLNAHLAIALWLSSDPRMAIGLAWRTSVLLGLVLGFMLQINYLAGVFIVAFCAAYALELVVRRPPQGLKTYFTNGFVIFAGFLLANLLVLAPIALWGDLANYLALQGRYLAGYGAEPERWRIHVAVVDVLDAYKLPLGLMVVMVLGVLWTMIRRQPHAVRHRMALAQMLIYTGCAVAGAIASGRLFVHYFLLITPMLSVSAAVFLANLPQGAVRILCSLVLVLAAAAPLTRSALIEAGLHAWAKSLRGAPPDVPAEIALAITTRLAAGETIYVYDYQHVLYYLTRVEPPTRYPFREHHLLPIESAAIGIKPAEEMRRILAHRPRFVVAGSDPHKGTYGQASLTLSEALDREYRLVRIYGAAHEPVWLYERRAP